MALITIFDESDILNSDRALVTLYFTKEKKLKTIGKL